MKRINRDRMAPPRLLLGAALLCWGAVTEHPLAGLLCAFLVEGRTWLDWRWEFGERGFARAWSLSLTLSVLAVAGFWLQGESVMRLFRILVWTPVFFLPLILAQQYATESRMPLHTFSFAARRKAELERAAGRDVAPLRIHFGYPYFALVIVASAFGRVSDAVFFTGLVVLAGLALFFASPSGRRRPGRWALSFGAAAGAGLALAVGFVTLYQALGGLYRMAGGPPGAGDRIRTAIGQLGPLKLSYRILWRIHDEDSSDQRLFREAVYNRYGLGHWTHRPMRGANPRQDYEDMESLAGEHDEKQFAFLPAEFELDPRSRRKLTIRGEVSTITPLPLPASTQRVGRVRGPLALLEYNSLGTVRLTNPAHGVADLDVFYGGAGPHELPPDLAWDLQVPESEREGIARVCSRWGLYDLPDAEVAARIRERFTGGFEYTLHRRYGVDTGPRYSRALTTFLEQDPERGGRRGHCEYFASAAVLLFREAGIPARYCVGFSAHEKDPRTGEWLLRGRHAHAWCRVYLGGGTTVQTDPATGATRIVWAGGRWVDFDPTPPGWFAIEGSGVPWERRLLDWWQRLREDFLVWRTTPGNRELVNAVMIVVAVLLVAYLAWRLSRSRTRRRAADAGRARRPVPAVVTPLHELSRSAEHWLGPRPGSLAFTRWMLRLGDFLPPCTPTLHRAVRYHWKARFDPLGLDPAEHQEFRTLCRQLKSALRQLRRDVRMKDRKECRPAGRPQRRHPPEDSLR